MLTDVKIRGLKPKNTTYRVTDSNMLTLEVTPKGNKLWRIRYSFDKKSHMIAAGRYPEVPLKEARERRDEIRYKIAHGEDPAPQKDIQPEAVVVYTFAEAAQHWFELNKPVWSPSYITDVTRRLNVYILPKLGLMPIADIQPNTVLTLIREIEVRGIGVTASRCLGICSMVMRLAVSEGKIPSDPCRDLKGALAPHKVKSFAALTTKEGARRIMQALDMYNGCTTIKNAVLFTALTFVRQNEIRFATWDEINWEEKQWLIPAERMKMRRDHIVPLSKQALEILEVQKQINGHRKYIFTFEGTGKPISENAVRIALRYMGFSNDEMTAHGFRSMASSLLNEQGWRSDIIERQLAHVDANRVRGIYNRAEYLSERREMMQSWADFLYALKGKA